MTLMSISHSFLPSPSRLFSKKARRSKHLTIETTSGSVNDVSVPQLPLHTPQGFEPRGKGLASSLSSLSLRHRTPRTPRTPVTTSFLPFGAEVVNISSKPPSFDQAQHPHPYDGLSNHFPRSYARADQAPTQCLPCPPADAHSHNYFALRGDDTYRDRYGSRRQSEQQPLYPTERNSLRGERPFVWADKSSATSLERYGDRDSDQGEPLNALDVLESFFDEDQQWQDQKHDVHSNTPPPTDDTCAESVRKRRAAFSLTAALTSSNALSSFPSSITTRIRRNSSRSRRPKRAKDEDGVLLPIHQRPLPSVPPPDTLSLRRQSYLDTLEPALESPIHLHPPRSDPRPPSSLASPSECLHPINEERRLSLPVSVRSHTITAHIIPPEELCRIGASRRGSFSSELSGASKGSEQLTEQPHLCVQDQASPLPRSPFTASFPSTPVGLQPPPRPRASFQTAPAVEGDSWAAREGSW